MSESVMKTAKSDLSDAEAEILSFLPKSVKDELFQFLASIKETHIFLPGGEPNEDWKVFYAHTLDSARKIALDVAGEENKANKMAGTGGNTVSMLDAAYKAAHETADRAGRDDILDAITLATLKAIDKAANGSGFKNAFSVGTFYRYAGLMGMLIALKDLEFEGKKEYTEFAERCMEVWRKGYGIATDLHGVLYVYARKPEIIM